MNDQQNPSESQHQDWQGGQWGVERNECHEQAPVRWTTQQRKRILSVLMDELGPWTAIRCMDRIEKEV